MDRIKQEKFGEQLVGVLNNAGLALMLSLGHRTQLFDVMSGMGPATSHEIAARAGLSERYVREWLGCMTTGGVVELNARDQTYWLPPEHAALLTRAASPNNLAASMQWVAVMGSVETPVAEAFKHGKGVPYSAYHRFHEVMAEESAQTVVAGLFDHILPLVPGLTGQLERGIDVLDIACGAGRAMTALAEAFPSSTFTGIDASEEAIALAESLADERRLMNVRFRRTDAATMTAAGEFDLITAFDAIHDQAKPDAVLRNIARALKPDGTFLMQDIGGSSCVHCNVGRAMAPFTYAISCMHCMSVSLAMGGPGLGAAWGRELAQRMLREAGFTSINLKELPHDIINEYYVCRKD